MHSSIQKRRLAENQGVFDLSGRTGVAPSPPAPPAPKAPKAPKPKVVDGTKSGGDGSQQAEALISAWESMTVAASKLETAAAYSATVKKGGKEAAEQLNKVRGLLLTTSADMKTQLIELAGADEAVAERVRSWLGGSSKPAAAPEAPPEPAPVAPEPPPAPPPPAPAPVAPPPAQPPAPLMTGAPTNAPAPAVAGAPLEGFLLRLDKALIENGITKERRQTSKSMKKVWQDEKTGGKNQWYHGGVKGNGYGSGGKFNNH